MTYKRKKKVRGNTCKKIHSTKRKTKCLDEIDNDLKEENARQLLSQDLDFDKPGAAQHYCLHCARFFIDRKALLDHFGTKVHKRRLKALELKPYTIEESERAAGKGNFVMPQKRKITTVTSEKDLDSPESKAMRVDE